MKPILPAVLLTVATLGMTSCYGPALPPPMPRGHNLDAPPRYGAVDNPYFEGTEDPNAAQVQPPDPNAPVPPPPGPNGVPTTPPVVSTPPANTPPPQTPAAPQPTPTPAPADIPYATRIPGKPGFVKSPFDPNGQAIDARDFTSGQKARCPYTGKIFRVP